VSLLAILWDLAQIYWLFQRLHPVIYLLDYFLNNLAIG